MIPRIDSGVSAYLIGTASIKVSFPIDLKGNPDVRCFNCMMYRPTSRRCGLVPTHIPEYPEHYVGSQCPLNFEEEK